jgi:hypothetical protein
VEPARYADTDKEFANHHDGGAAWQWFIITLIIFMFLCWLDLPSWR